MNKDRAYRELLSAYLDGELGGEEARFVEETLLADPRWKEEYEEMRRLKERMRDDLPRSAGAPLWPSLSRRLQSQPENNKVSIFPERLVPVAIALAVVVAGLGSFMITRNWDAVTAYFTDTKTVIGDIADRGIVRGALQPLFSPLFEEMSNDDLIRFAFSGIIPIPDAGGRGLRVDVDSAEEIELELADVDTSASVPTLARLYSDLALSDRQRAAVDSALTGYRDMMGSIAFVTAAEEIVIDPNIAGIDRFILASVARHLDHEQRAVFNNLLQQHNVDIRLPDDWRYFDPSSSTAEANNVAATRRNFLVVRPDSVFSAAFRLSDVRSIVAAEGAVGDARRTAAENLERAFGDVRIMISPHTDSEQDAITVRVYAHGGSSDLPLRIRPPDIQIKTFTLPEYQKDHFLHLKELVHQMTRHRMHGGGGLPQAGDTAGMRGGYRGFNERIEDSMRRLEIDLERLGEEIETIIDDQMQFLFTPDTLFHRFAPDTLSTDTTAETGD
jgi:hypothetical protein